MNEEQKQKVAAWFAAGASLDEIQKRLKDEGCHQTYVELRMFVADLPQPSEPEPPAPAEPPQPETESIETEPLPPETTAAEAAAAGEMTEAPPAEEAGGNPEVKVEVDALMIPGTIASGDVTFSDGKTGKWYVDRQGRLGLGNLPEGYQPSQADGILFQQKLMEQLQQRGIV